MMGWTPKDADISSGTLPAACNDWCIGDADSMSAQDIFDPTSDAGYTTAGASPKAEPSISFLRLCGVHIGQVSRLQPGSARLRTGE
jgi:hypothetical protein